MSVAETKKKQIPEKVVGKKRKKKKKKKKSKFSSFITTLGILMGLLLLAYPWIADFKANLDAQAAIQSYTAEVGGMSAEEKAKILAEADAYNALLGGDGQEYSKHPEYALDYNELLDYNSTGIIATIDVPKYGISQPVYHGTSEEVLMHGAGHLEGTSLPVGGINSHCMISGHTGMPGQRMFDDVAKMEKGDIVKLTVLDRKLYYKVEYSQIVLPEFDDYSIIQGEDILTIVTCYPYGINDHRLLVHCVRTDFNEADEPEGPDPISAYLNIRTIPFIVGTALAILLLVILGIRKHNKKKKKKLRAEKKKQKQLQMKKDFKEKRAHGGARWLEDGTITALAQEENMSPADYFEMLDADAAPTHSRRARDKVMHSARQRARKRSEKRRSNSNWKRK